MDGAVILQEESLSQGWMVGVNGEQSVGDPNCEQQAVSCQGRGYILEAKAPVYLYKYVHNCETQ
jgi:hypothetical protein